MTKEFLRKLLKAYTIDTIKDSLTMVYNYNQSIYERLTDKHIDKLTDLIINELKKE